jgi:hypothetical protein
LKFGIWNLEFFRLYLLPITLYPPLKKRPGCSEYGDAEALWRIAGKGGTAESFWRHSATAWASGMERKTGNSAQISQLNHEN